MTWIRAYCSNDDAARSEIDSNPPSFGTRTPRGAGARRRTSTGCLSYVDRAIGDPRSYTAARLQAFSSAHLWQGWKGDSFVRKSANSVNRNVEGSGGRESLRTAVKPFAIGDSSALNRPWSTGETETGSCPLSATLVSFDSDILRRNTTAGTLWHRSCV